MKITKQKKLSRPLATEKNESKIKPRTGDQGAEGHRPAVVGAPRAIQTVLQPGPVALVRFFFVVLHFFLLFETTPTTRTKKKKLIPNKKRNSKLEKSRFFFQGLGPKRRRDHEEILPRVDGLRSPLRPRRTDRGGGSEARRGASFGGSSIGGSCCSRSFYRNLFFLLLLGDHEPLGEARAPPPRAPLPRARRPRDAARVRGSEGLDPGVGDGAGRRAGASRVQVRGQAQVECVQRVCGARWRGVICGDGGERVFFLVVKKKKKGKKRISRSR